MARIPGRKREISITAVALAITVTGMLAGCQGQSKTDKAAEKPAVTRTETTPNKPLPPAPWAEKMRTWADTLRWTLDADDQITVDGLLFRLRSSVMQDYIGGPKAKDHPIVCFFNMTVRPVPSWTHTKGLKLDSVIYLDPVRNARLPTLRMLSSERMTEESTLRMQYTNNLAAPVEPQLTDGQLLHPTAFFTWDQRTMIVTCNPTPLKFVYELEAPPAPDTAMRWGPDARR